MGSAPRKAILLSCGSFNPPTVAHLRMMEVARDHLHSITSQSLTVVKGVFSPASSDYVHKPLAEDIHRLAMMTQATSSSDWLRVDDWESRVGKWTPTRQVLHHHREAARKEFSDDSLSCLLVCGGDLVESFGRILSNGSPLWDPDDVRSIVNDFGLVVVQRAGSSPLPALSSLGIDHSLVHVIVDDVCPNQVSSTLLRKAINERRSIKYCTPDGVIQYIEKHGLYFNPTANKDKNGVAPVPSVSSSYVL